MRRWFKRRKQYIKSSNGTSFYFFDFDDNIMFLSTRIFVRNKDTQEIKDVSTTCFATIHPMLGKQHTKWDRFETFDGTYKSFGDIPADELQPGQKQYFVEDVGKAIDKGDTSWQAPSWKLFAQACKKQRPLAIVTARGHSPKTIKAGVRVLVDKGLISQEPNYLSIYPVGNDGVRINKLNDPKLEKSTSELKSVAIKLAVDQAVEQYGKDEAHRFGMSDDDPKNVSLICKAMCDCKKKYPDKRFFVIDTHKDEMVKLEVFPIDYPVTRNMRSEFIEPLS